MLDKCIFPELFVYLINSELYVNKYFKFLTLDYLYIGTVNEYEFLTLDYLTELYVNKYDFLALDNLTELYVNKYEFLTL
jgi:hypothetical protein